LTLGFEQRRGAVWTKPEPVCHARFVGTPVSNGGNRDCSEMKKIGSVIGTWCGPLNKSGIRIRGVQDERRKGAALKNGGLKVLGGISARSKFKKNAEEQG